MSDFITPVNQFFSPIIPMTKLNGTESVTDTASGSTVKGASKLPFSNFLTDAINDVIETDKQVAADVQDIATGKTDDLHTLTINQTKAQIAVDMMVQMRNKILDAYTEIMRINI